MRISPILMLMSLGRFWLFQLGIGLAALVLALGLGFAGRELSLRAERSGLLLALDGVEARLAVISSSMAETVFLSRHSLDPARTPMTKRSLEQFYRPIVSRLRFIDSVLVTRGQEVLLYLKKDGERVLSLPPGRAQFAPGLLRAVSASPVGMSLPAAEAENQPVPSPEGMDLVWSGDGSHGGSAGLYASLRLPPATSGSEAASGSDGSGDGGGEGVLVSFGVDVTGLDDAHRTQPDDNSGVILFGYGDTLVGALDRGRFITPVGGVFEGVAGAAAAAFAESKGNYLDVVGFTWQGRQWRGVFDKLTLIDRTSFIGYAVPRREARASLGWGPELLWGLGALGLALGGAAMLALYYLRRRLRSGLLTVGLDRQLADKDVLAFIRAGERDDIEFKSTLRTSLYSGKADKRIELACVKTIAAFLNSKGGVLLVGVEDTGNVLGTEVDGFPSKDRLLLHFVNLFNQHIGAEHASFVSAQAVSVEDRVVLVVTCRPAETPVIVKSGDDEHYFVRVGPATNELSLSQVVALLRK